MPMRPQLESTLVYADLAEALVGPRSPTPAPDTTRVHAGDQQRRCEAYVSPAVS